MRLRRSIPAFFVAVAVSAVGWRTVHAQPASKNIKDNSFLIEEAYNQEPGVIQHIFNWYPNWEKSDGNLEQFTFQYVVEVPLGSMRHQLSFTPMVFEQFTDHPPGGPSEQEGGWGDTFLNYRYQLTMDEPSTWVPAISPRISLILPTGDEDRGLGSGELGYQFNLPISKELDRFAFHFNAGTTYTPGVSFGPGDVTSDQNGYNLGASAIWLTTYDFNVMLEFLTLWDEELNELGTIANTESVILNPGVRTAVFTGDEVQWVLGVGLPVGVTNDAPDYGVFVYMSVEHMFRRVD